MEHKFFNNLPYTEYSSLVLRNGGQDQWYAKIKEAVVLSLVEGRTKVLTQAYKTYVVYINGQYWGVYFLQEKRNEDFIARHEGISEPDSINLLYGSGQKYVINGTNEEYKELYYYVTSHDMSRKESFDYLAERFDTDSFMDLMVNQIYMANSDYYNLEFYQAPGGKWKQIFYDFCWAFREPEHKTLTLRMDPDNGGSTMFNALLKYEPWRKEFIERFAWAIKDIYSTERMLGVIDEVAGTVASEMPAERSKFTDVKAKDWNAQVEKLRDFARKRPEEMKKQLKSYFNLSDEEMARLFG